MGKSEINIGIIIQARMGSTRLPGKVLRQLNDRSLLDHVLDRLEALAHEVVVVVATSTEQQDGVIVEWCESKGVSCFRGSENDVLARYYQCATKYEFDQIVRLTADNPFMDVEELDRLIEFQFNEGNDYSHSFGSLPVGVGAEIFTFRALEYSFLHGLLAHHREHVNEYIQENPDFFDIGQLSVVSEKSYPKLRLTVDTMDDYECACRIAESVTGLATTVEAVEFCLRSA